MITTVMVYRLQLVHFHPFVHVVVLLYVQSFLDLNHIHHSHLHHHVWYQFQLGFVNLDWDYQQEWLCVQIINLLQVRERLVLDEIWVESMHTKWWELLMRGWNMIQHHHMDMAITAHTSWSNDISPCHNQISSHLIPCHHISSHHTSSHLISSQPVSHPITHHLISSHPSLTCHNMHPLKWFNWKMLWINMCFH